MELVRDHGYVYLKLTPDEYNSVFYGLCFARNAAASPTHGYSLTAYLSRHLLDESTRATIVESLLELDIPG